MNTNATANSTNRLINEKSPYLLQHAHNPVDWYPWGSEAFQKAKSLDRPVFLSIGYHTCHWCHIMERESFEDTEVAELLNSNFICIKVDREERPDVDTVYMDVCEALTGSGGWPLTVILTPDQKPFFAGTYIPKHTRYGMAGMMELLPYIAEKWQTNRAELLSDADELVNHINQMSQKETAKEGPSKSLADTAVTMFRKTFDSEYGGFGSAPKFPSAHNLLFLMNYSTLNGDENASNMAYKTLASMYRGGMFDHIGGGFSRYSTDRAWLVPHFEKMLYDNALLAYTYAEAYNKTKNPLWRKVATKTLDYTLRELCDPEGGFYCGQDADSEGVEGKYYVFTKREIMNVLGEPDGTVFCDWFGITDGGNFEGKNIPNLLHNAEFEEDNSDIDPLCKKLYDYRLTRTTLHKDDKVLTSWNALIISALCKASRVFKEPRYLVAAQKTHSFINLKLKNENGRLFIRWRDGEAANLGQLSDYSFYGYSLIELYESTLDLNYLLESIEIATKMVELFADTEKGGFFLYASDAEQLISRPKELRDGAMPSGNSVAAMLLGRLAKLTADSFWIKQSEKQQNFIASEIKRYPMAYSFALNAMLESLNPTKELVCVYKKMPTKKELEQLPNRDEIYNLNLLVKTHDNKKQLAKAAPFTDDYPIPPQEEAYYYCENGHCNAPVFSMDKLDKLLIEKGILRRSSF